MLLLKLLAPLLVLITTLLRIGLDYKWRDRRTKRHHSRLTVVLVSVMVLAAVTTLFVIYHDHQSFADQEIKLSEIHVQAQKAVESAEARERSAHEERNVLQRHIVALSERLDPFVELATARYPGSAVEDALASLLSEIKELQADALRARRGITVTYDYTGYQRTTGPGKITGDPGRTSIYPQIKKLHDEEKWSELIALCQEEMRNAPEWLTPYLFAGVAYANLGNRREAIKLL